MVTSTSKITIIDWIRVLLLDSSSANNFSFHFTAYEKGGKEEEIREGEGKRLENESRREASSGYKSDFKKP